MDNGGLPRASRLRRFPSRIHQLHCHYGLLRDVGERQTEMHSWQSEERWSRW